MNVAIITLLLFFLSLGIFLYPVYIKTSLITMLSLLSDTVSVAISNIKSNDSIAKSQEGNNL